MSGEWLQAQFADLVRKVATALRGFREKFFGCLRVHAKFFLQFSQRIADLLFGCRQFLEGQLIFAAQFAGAIVSLDLLGQFLLPAIERFKNTEVLLQFLHQTHVLKRLGDLLFRFLLHTAEFLDLFIGSLLKVTQHVR